MTPMGQEPIDLTHVQFVLLACTWWLNEQGERPNQVAVAAQAGTDIKMTSQVLRNLERKGLVEREVDTVDTRAAVFGLRNVERHSRRVRSRSSRRSTLVSSPTSPQLSRCASCALSRSWTWPSLSRVSGAAQRGRSVITSRTFVPIAASLVDATEITAADATVREQGQEFANDFHSSRRRSMSAARSAASLPSRIAASPESARK